MARTRAKRASYRHGVQWIADEDEAGSDDARNMEEVAGYVSTLLLADLFGKPPAEVASEIVRYRMENPGS